MRWVSAHIELIAFDMIAMHYLPQSMRSQPVVAPTRGPPLPVKVVIVGSFYILCAVGPNTVHKAYKNMLWDYQTGIKNWINAVTSRNAVGGRDGLYDMLGEAAKETHEGIAFCNLGSAALALKMLLLVRPFDCQAEL